MWFSGSGSNDHAAGGTGGRLWWRWNGDGYNVAPDINIGDGLTLVALTGRIVCARSGASWCWLSDGDSHGFCYNWAGVDWGRRNNSDRWGRNNSSCWLDSCHWRWVRIVSCNRVASGSGEVLSGQPSGVIGGSRLSCNRCRARYERCLCDPISDGDGSPDVSGCWFGGCTGDSRAGPFGMRLAGS